MFQPTYTPDDLSLPMAAPGRSAPERSLLERLLSPLDWGRQSLTNLGEGAGGLLSGDFSRQNFAKVAPGVGGILAGLLTGGAAAPFVGTGIASLLQGAGNDLAPEAMKAMSTQDLVSRIGGDPESTWHNLAVGAATDPWTYALGAGGLGLGKAGIGRAGKALDTAALARGPRFGMDATQLLEQAAKGGSIPADGSATALEAMLSGKVPARVMSEIPGGSQYLGHGGEGVALKTPYGRVIRLGSGEGDLGRPISEHILQADRGVSINPDWRVEHLPFAEPNYASPDVIGQDARSLVEKLQGEGIRFWDSEIGNLGSHQGRPVVIDPGAVEAVGLPSNRSWAKNPSVAGAAEVARQPMIVAKEPTRFTGRILDMLGADEKLRSALVRGRQNIDLAQSLPMWLKYGMGAIPAAAGASLPLALRGELGY